MKYYYPAAAFLAMSLVYMTGCSSTAESNLAGKWKGLDSSNTEAIVSFKRGNKLEIISGDRVFTASWKSASCDSPLELQLYPDGQNKGFIPLLAEITRDGSLMLTAGTDLKYQPTVVAKTLDQYSAKLVRLR